MRFVQLFVIVILIISFLWWSRGLRLNHLARENSTSPMPPDVARWLEAGLLTREQADAIVAFEERLVSPRKVSLFTEALGYVGAVLALAGGGVAIGQAVGYKNSIRPLTWDLSSTSLLGELGMATGSELSGPGRPGP